MGLHSTGLLIRIVSKTSAKNEKEVVVAIKNPPPPPPAPLPPEGKNSTCVLDQGNGTHD